MLKIKKSTVLALTALSSTVIFSQNLFAAEQNSFEHDASYAVGYLAGESLKSIEESQKGIINYNTDVILNSVKDSLEGKSKMSQEQVKEIFKQIEEKVQATQMKAIDESNQKLVAEFSKKPGVKKTKSGILYRIEKEGTGEKITVNDKIKVDYTGKLADGSVFDSSKERGPVEFPLNAVIKGWQEILPMIKNGGEVEMVIPASSAYGENGAGPIPPNATLYFNVHVLNVSK